MFDCMDLNIFAVVLVPSIQALSQTADRNLIRHAGSIVLAVKLICLGIGGVVFGIAADRFGRARILMAMIAIYAIFTGLSGLAQSWEQLFSLQAAAAFGVGGEWAVGIALIAEVLPDGKRDGAMGFVQSALATGFLMAAIVNWLLGPYSWRLVLAFGFLPAVGVLIMRMPESQRWLSVRARIQKPVAEAFGPKLRRSAIVGVIIAAAMLTGSWSGFGLLPGLIRELAGQSADPAKITRAAFVLTAGGSMPGYLAVLWVSRFMGRRPLYFLCAFAGLLASIYMFHGVKDLDALLQFAPIYGFFVMGGFAVLALCLPELFPTRVRATGQGFCFNVSQALAAVGPLALPYFGSAALDVPSHGVAVTLVAYGVGVVAIWFGPETWRKPLAD